MTEISIIILTKNAGKNIEKTLKKIFEQKQEKSFEVMVVDSGSIDETIGIIKKFPVKFFKIEPKDFQHGRTRNFVAEKAKGKYLVFISQDAVPVDNMWLEKLTKDLEKIEVAGVYGRQIPNENTNPMEKFLLSIRYPLEKKIKSLDTGLSKIFSEHLIISNVNSAIKKALWEKYKFPENIILGEDRDFGKKAIMAGYTIIYEPGAAVYHGHNYNLKTVFQRYFDEGVSLSQVYEDSEFNFKKQFDMGIKHILKELSFLIKNKQLLWTPYALLYNFAKCAAMFLGTKEQYLPIPSKCKRYISRNKGYWKS